MNLEPTNIISVSVAFGKANEYSVSGFWEDLTNYPSKTQEEIRNLLLAKYRERFPEAERIHVMLPLSAREGR